MKLSSSVPLPLIAVCLALQVSGCSYYHHRAKDTLVSKSLLPMGGKTLGRRAVPVFERKYGLTVQEARDLIKAYSKTRSHAPLPPDAEPIIVKRRLFFSVQGKTKLPETRERGYYVDPKTKTVEWVDTPRRFPVF